MQLPEDYVGGPLTQQEVDQLTLDEQEEARQYGYMVNVAPVPQGDKLFVRVTYSEPTLSGAGTAAAALADSAAKQGIPALVEKAAVNFQVPARLLAGIAFAESRMNPTAKNPKSSAFGLFQFLDATWADVTQKHGPGVGVRASDRADPHAQCLMGAAFTRDNQVFLRQKLKHDPSDGECYAAHFFGAGTAARLLSGPPGMRADTAIGPKAQQVIQANPSIFLENGAVRTVGQVLAELERRVSQAAAAAGDF